jgi:hypothetical protein
MKACHSLKMTTKLTTKSRSEVNMKLELEENEIVFLMNVLGELPTKSGAFLLLQKIGQQKAAQEQKTE